MLAMSNLQKFLSRVALIIRAASVARRRFAAAGLFVQMVHAKVEELAVAILAKNPVIRFVQLLDEIDVGVPVLTLDLPEFRAEAIEPGDQIEQAQSEGG